MAANNKIYEELSFQSFLTRYSVIIPMVQRDYAQGRETDDVNRVRSRFLEAIYRCLTGNEQDSQNILKLDFVYGEKEIIYSQTEVNKVDKIIVTPLDGQQRLTTLFLLHWYAAKKAEKEFAIQGEDYKFLENFTYNIRPSSRDFCSHLIGFNPELESSIKEQIKDQHWFIDDWRNDPTVCSMLVMLDAIKDKFSNIDNLWEKLTGKDERIIFFFLPLSENGLSDELYIKMNSRGKKLTAFEHFKAEFESIYERDSDASILVNHKFDVEWADVLFPYRDSEGIVDKEFMRYFFYISHILCYQQGIEKSNDEFKLIKDIYVDAPEALNNRKFLEDAFDCWYKILIEYKEIDKFFSKYFSCDCYEKGKVATYKTIGEYRNSQNFFHACIKLYQVNNNFSYSDFLFLYGIITYLLNRDSIQEEDFVSRIRMLRNLVWNSNSGEIRGDAEYMHDLLEEVRTLMLEGCVNQELKHGFNGLQEKEEIDKSEHKSELMKAGKWDSLLRFEDHPLIYGYVSGLGIQHLNLVDSFYKVFDCSLISVHRALISIGDYSQSDSNRYYLGNANRATWDKLLHKSNREGLEENTMRCLRTLLDRIENNETLDSIIGDYMSAQEEKNEYPWRYYFAKYPEMLRGADGEYTWDGNNDYICTALNKHQFNGKHWDPYLNVIYYRLKGMLKGNHNNAVLSLGDYGENLNILHPISSIASNERGFVYFESDRQEEWYVEQTEEGVDKYDRIVYAIDKIREVVANDLERFDNQ